VGAAAARRFAAEGAQVVLTDIDEGPLLGIASELGAAALAGDIGCEATVQAVAALAHDRHGRIDIWFSNAGSSGRADPGGLQTNDGWQQAWDLHVMAHVYASRAVLPGMLARGEGYLLHTASIVALAMQINNACYTVTKHAALSFSEWLAANFRPKGIRVSCFCPGPMDTKMLRESGLPPDHPAFKHALSPDSVAELLVRGIDAEKFLIGHHGPTDAAPELAMKAADYEAWLGTMSAMADR
jgi:NAD(P)-dependent dehydrogenase (short-subunit alcohol dehydrogenase family)